ncbi:MAG: DUF805 domain-containing protein [Bacilli bacterium]|nr:DUF805 domain-containing protein [Bacilli bacterium]
MVEAYKSFLKNYANFKGRTSRSDYWFVFLANFLIGFVLGIIAGIVPSLSSAIYSLTYIYQLAVLIPGIAIVVRRLHDINKSGWWYFIVLVPLVGWIILLVYLCTDSVNENNNYEIID